MSVSLVDRIRTSLAAAEVAAAVAGEASCSSKAWRSVLQVVPMRCVLTDTSQHALLLSDTCKL
jgi:hypothetical protein